MEYASPLLYAIPAKCDREHGAWLPLVLHLQDTAHVMRWLYDEWLPQSAREAMADGCEADTARALVASLALLHDLGKATPAFAAHIARTGGMPELLERLEGAGYPSFWPAEYAVTHAAAGEAMLVRAGAPRGFASVVGAHHGKPQNSDRQRSVWDNYGHLLCGRREDGDVWRRAQSALIQWAERDSGMLLEALPVLSQASQMLLCGMLVMADWIASNTLYFPLIDAQDDGRRIDPEQRFRRALERLRLPPCWQPEAQPSWADGIYDLRFGKGERPFVPRAMQREAARTAARTGDPGLMIIEGPMGSGKTEAALAAAELIASRVGAGGIFFGLPTQATSNALFERLRDWAQRQSEDAVNTIMLSHRMAMLNPDYRDLLAGTPRNVMVDAESGLEVHSFFQGRKTALLSSFVVGTVDQLLMAALRRKHVMLRQLGLAGKVVIVDEVHAYDAYMSQYLERALQWLGAWKTPVIMLSATLPAATRARLVDAYLGRRNRDGAAGWRANIEYPLLTWTDGEQVCQRALKRDGRDIAVNVELLRDEDRIDLLRDALSEGGCAGVICNTVARAQAFAEALSRAMPDTRVMLIHAQYVLPERARIEREILHKLGRDGDRPERLVLVGTQIIEQSLDIDFDLLITDLCPMDLLLQRIGRLHRHDRPRPGRLARARCCVTACSDDALRDHPIYAEYLLLRTRDSLPRQLAIPGDIAGLVQRVYRAPDAEDAGRLREAREKMERDIRTQRQRADTYRLGAPARNTRMRPATLDGMLEAEERSDEIYAEASVRDGGPSVEVLLLKRAGDGRARAVGGEEDALFPLDRVPSVQEAICIARQRLRLPWVLCAPWNVDETIAALERQTAAAAAEWRQSHWLGGELLLLLDARGEARLNGFRLRYDEEYGLICQREGEAVEGEAVL